MRTRLLWLLICLLAGLPAAAADFEFVVIGDTRPHFASDNFTPFEELITKINAVKPALVVNLGDLIYGYGPHRKETQWDKYQQVIQTLTVPYYQVPGNHDTHSKAARKIYGERFGKFFQSFDYGGCHFVLLDNTEDGRWGYLGPAELEWLKRDLEATRAPAVFVFQHFPVWDPERVTPDDYAFWKSTLHPLFVAHRVKAVFAGHYHAYGPTREYDGIRYFITGGGGAELRPEYKKSGGEHHFMRVKVSGDRFDVRVVAERGELSDSEADVMGGLQFAAKNVSRIGIKRGAQDLKTGVVFNVSVANPYPEPLTGDATWILDTSVFSVEPSSVALRIPVDGSRQYTFTLKALGDFATLQSLPRLQFSVSSGGQVRRFHREVRFLQELSAPRCPTAPTLDGQLADWDAFPKLPFGVRSQAGDSLSSCFDAQTLYLALTVPATDTAESQELGFTDEVQIGFARRLTDTDFSGDLLRLGIRCGERAIRDRTPTRKTESTIAGALAVCRAADKTKSYEIALPLRALKALKPAPGGRLILDVSFPAPDSSPDAATAAPPANTMSYRILYGSDSLVPVHFVELNLAPKKP